MPAFPNPYQVLRIPATASNSEVVAAGTARVEAESSDDRRLLYRKAVEALTTHPQESRYHRFWEPPGSAYSDPAEAAFVERYGAAPADRDALVRRARTFLEVSCAGQNLMDTLVEPPRPPSHLEECDARGMPESPLALPFGPDGLFR